MSAESATVATPRPPKTDVPARFLASRSACRPTGDYGTYRSFKSISGAGALTFDLDVGLGDRRMRRGETFRGPAVELLARPVDSPGRHGELRSQRVRAEPAASGADEPEGAQALGQRAGYQHRRCTGGQRPAELFQGVAQLALTCPVGY